MNEKNDWTLTYRRLVMPEDLNPANTLFGGNLLKWTDEGAALYAMCQMHTKRIVTYKISEVIFKEPVKNGEFLEFYAKNELIGTTSLSIKIKVVSKNLEAGTTKEVFSCDMIFVSVDEKGKKTPHNMKK